MTEVKRYFVNLDHGTLYAPRPGCDQPMVKAEDFDRVTAERDALQLDLNQRDEQIATLDLQREAHLRNSQVVERRVGVLEGLLRKSRDVLWAVQDDLGAISASAVGVMVIKIDAALKPAEGGGDE